MRFVIFATLFCSAALQQSTDGSRFKPGELLPADRARFNRYEGSPTRPNYVENAPRTVKDEESALPSHPFRSHFTNGLGHRRDSEKAGDIDEGKKVVVRVTKERDGREHGEGQFTDPQTGMKSTIREDTVTRSSEASKNRVRRFDEQDDIERQRKRAMEEDYANEELNGPFTEPEENWNFSKHLSKATMTHIVIGGLLLILGGLLLLLIVLVLAAICRRSTRGQRETTAWGIAGECLGVECFVGVHKRVTVQSPDGKQPSQPLLQSSSGLSGGPPSATEPQKPENEGRDEQAAKTRRAPECSFDLIPNAEL